MLRRRQFLLEGKRDANAESLGAAAAQADGILIKLLGWSGSFRIVSVHTTHIPPKTVRLSPIKVIDFILTTLGRRLWHRARSRQGVLFHSFTVP